MIDSGANTCGSPTFVAKHYNLEIFQGKKLSIDSFNGTSTTTTSYANFGPILGVVPVSDEFEEFILAECILTKQGINLFKYKEAAILLDPDGSVLCTAPVNRLNNFHYVQLDDLMVLKSAIAGARAITTKQHEAVINLHRRMGHASVGSMITCLESHEWECPDVTAVMIKQVFAHTECIICSLTKRNSVSIPDGSQVIPLQPGDQVSIDELPRISPPAIGNLTAATLAVDGATNLFCMFLFTKI
jgi:hypothetical protein